VIKANPLSLFSSRIRFKGMVGGKEKGKYLNTSKGLIFPVLWHEPFGLAIIESLFYGCPIFGTPYGSLKELINKDVGYLSTKKSELVESLKYADDFDKKICHEYALENFNSKKMTLEYLNKYHEVLNGHPLNQMEPQLINIQKEKYLAFD
jgi:glycosyltransferase involved in cell wall biosynthesis